MVKEIIEQIVTAPLPTLGVLFTAFTAFFAWRSAIATQSNTEAQLYARLMEEYRSPQMLKALRTVLNWADDIRGQNLTRKYSNALKEPDEDVLEVDEFRRLIKGYFLKALRLYEGRYVKEKFLKSIANVYGINILYDIVEPLEFGLNPDFDNSEFKRLREICPPNETTDRIRPIPTKPKKHSSKKKPV